jgi:hypothetical protein
MAARQASFSGVEEVLKRALASSFSAGIGANDPAAKTASAAQEIRDTTNRIYQDLQALPEKIGAFFKDLPGRLATAIREGAAQLGRSGGDAIMNRVFGTGPSNDGANNHRSVDTLRGLDSGTIAPAANDPFQGKRPTFW